MGDMIGLKGKIVNMVVRRVKKMVKEWNIKGNVRLKDEMEKGREK